MWAEVYRLIGCNSIKLLCKCGQMSLEYPHKRKASTLQASLKDDTTRNGNLAIHRNFKTT